MKKNDWYAIACLVATLLIAIIAYEKYVHVEEAGEVPKIQETNVDDSSTYENTDEEELSRHDTIWLMAQAFSIQESRENPYVVSKCGRYVGCLQISKVMLREANRILGEKRYTHGDNETEDHRLSKKHSYEIFRIIMERHNPDLNMDRAVDIWNKNAPDSYRNNVKNNFYRLLEK